MEEVGDLIQHTVPRVDPPQAVETHPEAQEDQDRTTVEHHDNYENHLQTLFDSCSYSRGLFPSGTNQCGRFAV